MTREEAISVLERVAHTESKWPGTEDTLEALDMAISALRQQEQLDKVSQGSSQDKPLTLDELREAAETGDPVWLVGMEDGDGWVRIDGVYSLTIGYSRFGDTETWCFRKASYGVRVWAYRQKPEESCNG